MKCIRRFSYAYLRRYALFDYSHHRYLPRFSSHIIVLPFRPPRSHCHTRGNISLFGKRTATQRRAFRSDSGDCAHYLSKESPVEHSSDTDTVIRSQRRGSSRPESSDTDCGYGVRRSDCSALHVQCPCSMCRNVKRRPLETDAGRVRGSGGNNRDPQSHSDEITHPSD